MNVKECEGINPHTPKGAPILGVKVPVDSRIFREQLPGSKPLIEIFVIPLESSWNVDV
jgi:hypothetical protein